MSADWIIYGCALYVAAVFLAVVIHMLATAPRREDAPPASERTA